MLQWFRGLFSAPEPACEAYDRMLAEMRADLVSRKAADRKMEEEELFYIQHTGFVGNSLLWWREEGSGYTCNLDEAWKLSWEDAEWKCMDRPKQDIPRSVKLMDSIAERHVDAQDLYRVTPSEE